MNKVILIGNLTRDPEMRTTGSGVAVTRFTVAVSRQYTDQNGERGTDFIGCVAFRRQAENIAKYCKKGSKVAIEGRIQTGSYDAQDGTKRYTTDVLCENCTFLNTRSDNGNASSYNQDSYPESDHALESVPSSDITEDPFKDFGSEIALSDDDLPF